MENFGPTGLLDAVNKTDKSFRKWMERLTSEFGPGTEHRARELINQWENEKASKPVIGKAKVA
jgi:hypothetical protein